MTAPTLEFTPVDPQADAPLIHRWATEDRGVFWGMGDHTVRDVREVYTWIDEQPTHHAWLLRDGDAVLALFQTYEPEHDPVGEAYDVQEGDLGVHLMLAPAAGEPTPGYTARVTGVLKARAFEDPATRRVVVEPDARNDKAVALVRRLGFELGPVVQLPHKPAQLAFLTRAAAGF